MDFSKVGWTNFFNRRQLNCEDGYLFLKQIFFFFFGLKHMHFFRKIIIIRQFVTGMCHIFHFPSFELEFDD